MTYTVERVKPFHIMIEGNKRMIIIFLSG